MAPLRMTLEVAEIAGSAIRRIKTHFIHHTVPPETTIRYLNLVANFESETAVVLLLQLLSPDAIHDLQSVYSHFKKGKNVFPYITFSELKH